MSVTIRLEDDIDVGRGDMLADPERAARRRARARGARLLDERAAARAAQRASSLKHTTRTVRAVADELVSVVDIADADRGSSGPERLELNDIGRVGFRLAEPLAVDPYAQQPRHRRVHPDRRVDERDRRRRHGPARLVMTWEFSLAGLLVGVLVGMTGMGGGS